MEVKILCDCGQKYIFDVEPLNGRMPSAVSCPGCGVDGTHQANSILAQAFSSPSAAATLAPPLAAANPSRLRVNLPTPDTTTAGPTSPVSSSPQAMTPRPHSTPTAATSRPTAAKEFNIGLGILGALLGAGVGVAIMYGFFALAGFRFPLLGVGIGALAGYGARLFSRGTDTTLGIITAVIAAAAVFGTLYIMFGELALLNIISIIVSVSVAYRIASG